DHYLRLQALLDKIDGLCAPEGLRTLLCPIFAASKSQQEQFYIIFDSYFDLFHKADELTETNEAIEGEEQQAAPLLKSGAQMKWLYVLAPVAVAAIIIFAVLLFRPKQVEQSAQNPVEIQAAPQVETSQASTKSESTTVNATDVPAASRAQEETSQPTPQPTPPATAPTFYQSHSSLIHFAIILLPLFLFLL